MSRLTIIRPRPGYNRVVNSSFETVVNGLPAKWTITSDNGGNVVSVMPQTGRYGARSCSLQHAGGTLKIYQDVALLSASPLSFSVSVYFYVYNYPLAGNVKVRMTTVPLGGAQSVEATLPALTQLGWTTLAVSTASITPINGKVRLEIQVYNTATVYIDGALCETTSTPGTYFDGSFPGCVWSGALHASESKRVSGAGGDPYALSTNHTLKFVSGFGMPAITSDEQTYGAHDGGYVTNVAVNPRDVALGFVIAGSPTASDTFSGNNSVMDERATILQQFAPVRTPLLAPATLQFLRRKATMYVEADERELDVFYQEGMGMEQFGGHPNESFAIRCRAPSPFFRATKDVAVTVPVAGTLSSITGGLARLSTGMWLAGTNQGTLTTPFSGTVGVYCAVRDTLDPDLIWIGGNFQNVVVNSVTTASGGLALYNTRYQTYQAFSTIATGLTGLNGIVYDIFVDTNGDLYIAGDFSQFASGIYYQRVVRYNRSTTTYTALGYGFATTIYTITLINDVIYVGGVGNSTSGRYTSSTVHTTFTGVAALAKSAISNTAVWSNVGTLFGTIRDMVASSDATKLYVAAQTGELGSFGSGTSCGIAQIVLSSGTTTALGSPTVLPSITALYRDPITNTLYCGGSSTSITGVATLVGNTWVSLGSGLWTNGARPTIYALTTLPDGQVFVGGDFTHINGTTQASTEGLATWNGYTFAPYDIDLSFASVIRAVAGGSNDTLFLGLTGTGSATAAGALTTVLYGGSTPPKALAPTYPILRCTGPGRIVAIRNTTTGQSLDSDYTLVSGEFLDINCHPEAFRVTSSLKGDVAGMVLGSGMTLFQLVPGANAIFIGMTGTDANSGAHIIWREQYWSVD